jgi:hypothetical protein
MSFTTLAARMAKQQAARAVEQRWRALGTQAASPPSLKDDQAIISAVLAAANGGVVRYEEVELRVPELRITADTAKRGVRVQLPGEFGTALSMICTIWGRTSEPAGLTLRASACAVMSDGSSVPLAPLGGSPVSVLLPNRVASLRLHAPFGKHLAFDCRFFASGKEQSEVPQAGVWSDVVIRANTQFAD